MAWTAIASPFGRTRSWRCTTDRRLEVRHCGHPTANYPYYIRIDGQDRMDLGTHRLLARAQHAALLAADRSPPAGQPGTTTTSKEQ